MKILLHFTRLFSTIFVALHVVRKETVGYYLSIVTWSQKTSIREPLLRYIPKVHRSSEWAIALLSNGPLVWLSTLLTIPFISGTEKYHPAKSRIYVHPGSLRKSMCGLCTCGKPPKTYRCCDRRQSEIGCIEKWACCKKTIDAEGCAVRYECCQMDIGTIVLYFCA